MKHTTLICSVLLACSSICLTASPDELWQKYQEHPSTVSTMPVKPTVEATTTPAVTVETSDGNIVTPKQQTTAAEPQTGTTSATDDSVATKGETAAAINEPAKVATAATDVTTAKTDSANNEQVITKEAATNTPVVSNKPIAPAAKPKPKPDLVGKPPLPKQYLRTPQASDFATVTNVAGGYSLAVPNGFGSDPLAQLPGAEGTMLVRTASEILMFAATVLDAGDSISYNTTESLPTYADAKLYCEWQHPGEVSWDCRLAHHNDYHGDKLLLQAQAQQAGKTYQLLFVMPKAKQDIYLAQALYSLHSFKLL